MKTCVIFCAHIERNYQNVCRSETYFEHKLWEKVKNIFYVRVTISTSLMVFEIIKQELLRHWYIS
jgi:hypothetical protein